MDESETELERCIRAVSSAGKCTEFVEVLNELTAVTHACVMQYGLSMACVAENIHEDRKKNIHTEFAVCVSSSKALNIAFIKERHLGIFFVQSHSLSSNTTSKVNGNGFC